jgi:hypothetical protein
LRSKGQGFYGTWNAERERAGDPEFRVPWSIPGTHSGNANTESQPCQKPMAAIYAFLRTGLRIGFAPTLLRAGKGARHASSFAESTAAGSDFKTRIVASESKAFELCADMPEDGGGRGEKVESASAFSLRCHGPSLNPSVPGDGPSPKDLAMAGLAACTSMTIQTRANRNELMFPCLLICGGRILIP